MTDASNTKLFRRCQPLSTAVWLGWKSREAGINYPCMTPKQERRAMRHELYAEAVKSLSLNARMSMTPAQIKHAARVMTDRAIAQVVNA